MAIPEDEPDHIDDAVDPDENLLQEWSDEDVEIEGRKPDLGEIEEDTSEL